MTYGIDDDFSGNDLAEQLSAIEDRQLLRRVSSSNHFTAGPSLEVSRTWDPSDGANMQGGVADAAARTGNNFRDVKFGGMSYEEAMNYSPSPLTEQIGSFRNLRQVGAQVKALDGFGATPEKWGWGTYLTVGVLSLLLLSSFKDMFTPKQPLPRYR